MINIDYTGVVEQFTDSAIIVKVIGDKKPFLILGTVGNSDMVTYGKEGFVTSFSTRSFLK